MANQAHPLFPELRSMVSKAMGIEQVIDSILTRCSMRIAEILEGRSDWPAHFSVVEDDRIRMRPLSPTYRTRLIPNK